MAKMATVLAKLHLHGNDRIRRLDRKQIMILRKNENRHSIHRPPKTPISEVWSKIDKDWKSRPNAIKKIDKSIASDRSVQKNRKTNIKRHQFGSQAFMKVRDH